jgi:TPR repeat protein
MFGLVFLTRFKINRMMKKLSAMQRYRVNNQPSAEALKKEIAGYHWLASLYTRLERKKKFPFAREAKLAALRAAAMLDDVASQFQLGKLLLDEAKVRLAWQTSGVFASMSNQRMLTQLFEEVHAYFLSAEKQAHIQAKRLRGLCYINGWGVPEDKKLGFELVMASIQQENSWERVPQIFASLGLNKPEFFSALTEFRQKT